jgi:hypothetical protein
MTAALLILMASQGPRQVLFKVELPLVGPSTRITALAHSIDLGGCVAATSDGGLFFLEASNGELHELGQLDAAVVDMQWSPDAELLAVATASGGGHVLHCPASQA